MNKNVEISSTLAEMETTRSATTAGVEALLLGHPFLAGLNPQQIHLLKDCAMVMRFQPGEFIFREGDPANRFYLIHTGEVALEAPAREHDSVFIQTVGAGEVLGWSWIFPPYHWQFDARAVTATEAIFLYATPLREECEARYDFGYELMKRMAEVMMKRLQATRKQLLDLKGNAGKSPCGKTDGCNSFQSCEGGGRMSD